MRAAYTVLFYENTTPGWLPSYEASQLTLHVASRPATPEEAELMEAVISKRATEADLIRLRALLRAAIP